MFTWIEVQGLPRVRLRGYDLTSSVGCAYPSASSQPLLRLLRYGCIITSFLSLFLPISAIRKCNTAAAPAVDHGSVVTVCMYVCMYAADVLRCRTCSYSSIKITRNTTLHPISSSLYPARQASAISDYRQAPLSIARVGVRARAFAVPRCSLRAKKKCPVCLIAFT